MRRPRRRTAAAATAVVAAAGALFVPTSALAPATGSAGGTAVGPRRGEPGPGPGPGSPAFADASSASVKSVRGFRGDGARTALAARPRWSPSAGGDGGSSWSGQNSYTQRLLRPVEDARTDHRHSASGDLTEDIAAQMVDDSRKSFVAEQEAAASSSSSGEVNDPREMEFANYMFALQRELEAVEKGEEPKDRFLDMVSNKPLDTRAESEKAATPNVQEGVIEKTAQAEPKPSSELTEEELEDRFLKMVSNELEYKKLIGESIYAVNDIEWPTLLQRFLDNLEDGTQKNNGKFKGKSRLRGRGSPKEERKTIVVVSSCKRRPD